MTTLPTTMRHVIFDGAGGPEVVKLADAPVPQPGRGEVLVKVAAAGVNRPDVAQRGGSYPPPAGETNIPGLEIAGHVVAVGADVVGPALGEAVCALVGSGGYADYALAQAVLCLPVPKGLSLTEAAGIPETYFTVFDNVFTRGRLRAGETLLVHGGSSGIGSTAIQLAKAFGATVIVTAGSAEKCAFCHAIGADHAIDYKTQDFVAEVQAITDKRGVDVCLDMVGGSYTPRNLSIMAVEGRLVQVATLGGVIVEKFDLRAIMGKRLTLTGSTLRPRALPLKAAIAQQLRNAVWPLLDAGTVKPVIHAIFPLAEASAAHALMDSSAHCGKIMLETGL